MINFNNYAKHSELFKEILTIVNNATSYDCGTSFSPMYRVFYIIKYLHQSGEISITDEEKLLILYTYEIGRGSYYDIIDVPNAVIGYWSIIVNNKEFFNYKVND